MNENDFQKVKQMNFNFNISLDSQVSVLRGSVLTSGGDALAGVKVFVPSQPLYGYTRSRKDGVLELLFLCVII